MKTILLTVVLGIAASAGAQSAAQPAQAQPAAQQPAASGSQAPVIKDPAEYNAYVSAVQQTDANAKISGLEAFNTQYPNSVMKNQALEVLMGAYQQAGNAKKTLETANKLVAADPCNMRALALLAYYDRVLAQNAQAGDPNAQQELADGKKFGQQGLDCWAKVTDPEIKKMQPQMDPIFKSAEGIADLTAKDYNDAITELKAAADANPTDFTIVYPLALAYWPDPKTPATPENSRFAIWYAARASAIAPPQAQAQLEKYARSLYVRFHAGDDGWTDLLAKAKAGTAAPADLEASIKPAPTPAEQAHKMVQDTADSGGKVHPEKMDFATWEFVLSNGAQVDQDLVWNGTKDADGKVVVAGIKGQAVQMNGTIIGTTPTEFQIAGSSDDIDAKKADITLQFETAVPKASIPKDGASFDFRGEPASYTPSPFMMTMDKGALLKAAAPAKRAAPAPAHKKPAASN